MPKPKQLEAFNGQRLDGFRKVCWTVEERTMLARRAAELFDEGHSSSCLRALNQAQNELLAPERRRRLLYIGQAAGMEQRIQEEMQARCLARVPPQEEEPEAEIEEEPSAAAAQPSPSSLPVIDPKMLFDAVRTVLVDELANVIIEAMRKAGVRAAEDAPPPQVEPIPKFDVPYSPYRARRESVLIVGLKGAQMELIKHDFGRVFDLRFHGTNDAKAQLRQSARSAGATVVMTDFINHSVEDIARAASPRFVRSPGGMDKLRQTLRTLAGLTHTTAAGASMQ